PRTRLARTRVETAAGVAGDRPEVEAATGRAGAGDTAERAEVAVFPRIDDTVAAGETRLVPGLQRRRHARDMRRHRILHVALVAGRLAGGALVGRLLLRLLPLGGELARALRHRRAVRTRITGCDELLLGLVKALAERPRFLLLGGFTGCRNGRGSCRVACQRH